MRIQKRLTVAILIKLLTITLCVLGCGQGQEATDETVFVIQALAHVKGTLYLGAQSDGVFRFNNRSQSWHPLFYDGVTRSLASDDTTLYVSTSMGIYQLEKDGETFRKITSQGKLRGATLVADGRSLYASWDGKLFRRKKNGSEEWHQINTSWDSQRIHSLLVKENTIYVLTQQHGIFSSIDGGNSWTVINTGLPDQPVTSIGFLLSPLLLFQNTIYLGTRIGIYRLPIGTISWIPSGLHDRDITSLAASGTALYAAVWNQGVFRSEDGGHSWQYIGFDGLYVRTLAVFENRLYVGTESKEGLFFSTDDGNTWHPLNKGLKALEE